MRKTVIFTFFLAVLLTMHITALQIQEIEFNNKEITDILLVLAEMSGSSIVPDETISGNATYYFTQTDFETALDLFLSSYKMYYKKENGVYYVSRIQIDYEDNLVSMDAEDVNIQLIVRALSKAIGRTILFDSLPSDLITIHVKKVSPEKILGILIKKYPDYLVETDEDFYYIKRQERNLQYQQVQQKGSVSITKNEEGKYSIELKKERLTTIIELLFKEGGYEYSMLFRNDSYIENLYFKDKDFNQLLRLILEHVNADFKEERGVYHIFEINRNEILKNYNINIYLPLKHISVNELPNIIPQELLSGSKYKMDIKNNSILLSGSELEIMSLKEFIESIDESMEGNIYYRFDLKYLTVQDFTGILPDRYKHSNPRIIPGINSFVMLCTQDTRNSIEEYIELVDKKNEGIPVHLKYITAEDLLKNIPPSVEKTEIIETGNPSVIFFTGSEDKREQFLREMEVIDRPVPQIRYELLVVQYQESKSLKWGLGLEASLSNANSQNYFLGNIGQLLSLNFDIVSSFGYVFAANLSLELGDSSAKIFADTTLNGLSGEEINFQNTNTYRYRDMEIDPDTGEAKSTGVTREITSGLMINLNGRTLGDNIVTMNISATVSKTGVDTSATAGTPPPTSEKIIKTHVRTESGKPVIISGLIQQDVAVSIKRVPILGSIPLLGWLFRSEVYSKENTEMEIYIIPHVVYPEGEEIHIGRRLEQIYQKYVKRY